MGKPARSGHLQRSSLFLLCGPLLLAGCGGSQGTVSGKVLYLGKPLPAGNVTFIPEKGGALTAEIKEDGSYTISKVPIGPAKITVETQSVRPPAQGGFAPPMPPKDAIPSGVDPSKLPGFQGQAKKYVQIPEPYSDPQKSGLSHTVESGKHEHTIELK